MENREEQGPTEARQAGGQSSSEAEVLDMQQMPVPVVLPQPLTMLQVQRVHANIVQYAKSKSSQAAQGESTPPGWHPIYRRRWGSHSCAAEDGRHLHDGPRQCSPDASKAIGAVDPSSHPSRYGRHRDGPTSQDTSTQTDCRSSPRGIHCAEGSAPGVNREERINHKATRSRPRQRAYQRVSGNDQSRQICDQFIEAVASQNRKPPESRRCSSPESDARITDYQQLATPPRCMAGKARPLLKGLAGNEAPVCRDAGTGNRDQTRTKWQRAAAIASTVACATACTITTGHHHHGAEPCGGPKYFHGTDWQCQSSTSFPTWSNCSSAHIPGLTSSLPTGTSFIGDDCSGWLQTDSHREQSNWYHWQSSGEPALSVNTLAHCTDSSTGTVSGIAGRPTQKDPITLSTETLPSTLTSDPFQARTFGTCHNERCPGTGGDVACSRDSVLTNHQGRHASGLFSNESGRPLNWRSPFNAFANNSVLPESVTQCAVFSGREPVCTSLPEYSSRPHQGCLHIATPSFPHFLSSCQTVR